MVLGWLCCSCCRTRTIPGSGAILASARHVKFNQRLESALTPGSHITFKGTPDEDIQWFTLNLVCGLDPNRGDTALHFNVRMPQCYVVRNTKRHDHWGTEENTAFRAFPFKTGRPFIIEVLIEERQSQIAVDGEHYCVYTHRNPTPLQAGWIQVIGVKDAVLNVCKVAIYPVAAEAPKQVPYLPTVDHPKTDEPSWKPNVVGTLSEGIKKGQQVVVIGRLRPILHSFTINLTDKPQEWPNPYIYVHVNLRPFDDSQNDRQLVVLNTWFGAWGKERRQRSARLIPGYKAIIRIVYDDMWSVFADNSLIGELEIRGDPSAIKSIKVRGDFAPERICVCPVTRSPSLDRRRKSFLFR